MYVCNRQHATDKARQTEQRSRWGWSTGRKQGGLGRGPRTAGMGGREESDPLQVLNEGLDRPVVHGRALAQEQDVVEKIDLRAPRTMTLSFGM